MLRELHISIDPTLQSQAYCYDILRRNNTSLTNLQIIWSIRGQNSGVLFSVDALAPSTLDNHKSKLTKLEIQGLVMTRDAFSSLLRMSPLLKSLAIRDTILLSEFATEIYQHQKVSSLTAAINQVFRVDSQTPNSPSLFAHFPNLTLWRPRNSSAPTLDIPSRTIKTEISRYCHRLSSIYAQMPAPLAVDLLSQGAERLTSVCVRHEGLSSDLVLAILNHQATLKTVKTFNPDGINIESTEPLVVIAPSQTTRWAVQMLPRLCASLKVFSMVLQEMDMDDVEKGDWVCKDLSTLYIRIRGLNSKGKISRAIKLWLEWRSNGMSSMGGQEAKSIEKRVARHLLKFSNLNEVWLGTTVVTVPRRMSA